MPAGTASELLNYRSIRSIPIFRSATLTIARIPTDNEYQKYRPARLRECSESRQNDWSFNQDRI